jgi:diguanylate cyclase (GGDEF)-like protein
MPEEPSSRARPPLHGPSRGVQSTANPFDPQRGGGPAVGGLATKIIFVVFLSTFLTAVLVSWISVYSTHTFLQRKLEQTFPAIAAGGVDRAGVWFDEGRLELSRMAAARPDPDEATLTEWLGRAKHFEALVRTDPAGRILASAGSAGDVVPPAASGRWYADDASGMPRLGAGVGLGADGKCCLHGLFSRSRLRPLLAVDGLGSGGVLHLVDAGGRILVSGRLTGSHGPGTQLPLGLLTAGNVVYYGGSDEARRVGALRPIPGTMLNVVVEEPYEAAFEPVFAMVKRVFVIDLGILILFSLVAHQVTGAIVRPIQALSDGARRISQGELDVELVESEKRDEIGLLTRTFNDMTRKLLSHRAEIERANQQLVAQNAELQRANEVLEQLSITDGLTRLHNHRFFQDHLTREIKRVSRTSEHLAMLMCDIDDFKRLNDRLGHAAGDELLAGIARTLDESVRETDFLARYGGEEFVVLCPDTDLAGALNVAEKVRSAVSEGSFLLDGTSQLTKITISIGVAQFEGSRRAFFKAADQALYRAKAAGKNCVKAAGEVPGYPDV